MTMANSFSFHKKKNVIYGFLYIPYILFYNLKFTIFTFYICEKPLPPFPIMIIKQTTHKNNNKTTK